MPQEAPKRERDVSEHRDVNERREGMIGREGSMGREAIEREEEIRGEGLNPVEAPRAPETVARQAERDETPPFPDYRRRTAEELVKRIRQLPEEKLGELERYERGYKSRKTILEAVRRRREQISA